MIFKPRSKSARYGDVIVLEAGATYRGPIILPFKESTSDSEQYITITTSNPNGIPAENQRVNPQIHAAGDAENCGSELVSRNCH